MKGNWRHGLEQSWMIVQDHTRKLIGIPRRPVSPNIKPLSDGLAHRQRQRLQVTEVVLEQKKSGYVWAAKHHQVRTDERHILVTVGLPEEPFDQLVVRKLGNILHIEVEQLHDDPMEPPDPVERFMARRESSIPKVLRRAIPLPHVTEEPVWLITEDHQLQIKLQRSVISNGRSSSAEATAKPSGPQRALKPKRLQKAKDT
jgi:hypothetical protein